MLSGSEIARALQGCWLLFRNRPEGMRYLDQSLEGFWRSFAVIILVTPMFALSTLSERKLLLEEANILPENFPDGVFWLAQFTRLAMDWVTLPLVLAALAKPIGITRGYVPFVVARNWSSLLVSLPYAVGAALYVVGVIAPGIMVLFSLATLLVVIWYQFVVARITLQGTIATTIGVVVLDIVLSLLIGEISGRLWGV